MAAINGLNRASDLSELYATRRAEADARIQKQQEAKARESDERQDEVSLSAEARQALGSGEQQELSPQQVKEALALQSVRLANESQASILELFG